MSSNSLSEKVRVRVIPSTSTPKRRWWVRQIMIVMKDVYLPAGQTAQPSSELKLYVPLGQTPPRQSSPLPGHAAQARLGPLTISERAKARRSLGWPLHDAKSGRCFIIEIVCFYFVFI